MMLKAFPGYENHLRSYMREETEQVLASREAHQKAMAEYKPEENIQITDRVIAGGDGQDLNIRIYRPDQLPEQAPMVLDIHGGGFVAGNLDVDVFRCCSLAKRIPAVVVSVDYRLCLDGVCFPAPLKDCHATYMWMFDHAKEIGGDPDRMGLYGSSAGGCLAAGLALYLRDKNEPAPLLTVPNCATYTPAIEESMSYQQLKDLRMGPDNKALNAEATYLGGYDGTQPSYYAFPALAHDLGGLQAHFVIAGEYDTLRDSGIEYAARLLRNAVPTELFVAGRQAHCFTGVPHPYTDLIHDLIAASFQREFGLLDQLKIK